MMGENALPRRAYILILGMGLVLGTLAGRLLMLQIIQAKSLADRALRQRSYQMEMEQPRGRILDRYGASLTGEFEHESVFAFPSLCEDKRASAQMLAEVLNLDYTAVYAELNSRNAPFRLKAGVTRQEKNTLAVLPLPGVLILPETVRYGPGALARHTVGYVSRADNIGVAGLEKEYDACLRSAGVERVMALLDGNKNLILPGGYRWQPNEREEKGKDIYLTLDAGIQSIVEAVMERRVAKGAVAVVQADTGEILALASRPNFDQNDLAAYLTAADAPLLNRVVNGYPPGSVFKYVVAAAALEEGSVHPEEKFICPGYTLVNGRRFQCHKWEEGGHGELTFAEAFAASCNSVFIEVGQRLSGDTLRRYAAIFGCGQKTGSGIGEEDPGLVDPRPILYPGDIANLSIGQGSLLVTPLQVARILAAVVNDGLMLPLRLVRRAGQLTTVPAAAGTRIMSADTARTLREMSFLTTTTGTGRAAFVPELGSAGKTGSAETGRYQPDGKSILHVWFAGYAPADDPEIVVVVLVEDGVSGSETAAPVFREIIEAVYR
ncbi:MAG: peptidoglycan D,D-transpeptidase FtsI family protein [bacterium]|jgi:penicillin-binding protein 2